MLKKLQIGNFDEISKTVLNSRSLYYPLIYIKIPRRLSDGVSLVLQKIKDQLILSTTSVSRGDEQSIRLQFEQGRSLNTSLLYTESESLEKEYKNCHY